MPERASLSTTSQERPRLARGNRRTPSQDYAWDTSLGFEEAGTNSLKISESAFATGIATGQASTGSHRTICKDGAGRANVNKMGC